MVNQIREDAANIIEHSIKVVLPEASVQSALEFKQFKSGIVVIAIGKAAWRMAKAASEKIGSDLGRGLIITKSGHSMGEIDGFEIIESGHPIPDENSMLAAEKAISYIKDLTEHDEVLILLSGGGSALFEKPLDGVRLIDIMDITEQLLGSGANIIEINTVRKHLSAVKGGRFAKMCKANIFAVILSDVVGDRLDFIASGPVCADQSTSDAALKILKRYGIITSDAVIRAIKKETPKIVHNCTIAITGNVKMLCEAVAKQAKILGYEPKIISTKCELVAVGVGRFFGFKAADILSGKDEIKPPCAVIIGGETVVNVKGSGMGGRNQEVALSAAIDLEGKKNCVVFSLGSDGTDGPTDAAGGMVDGFSVKRMAEAGVNAKEYLKNNDSYHALKSSGDLIITGATGTNVNDVMVLLML